MKTLNKFLFAVPVLVIALLSMFYDGSTQVNRMKERFFLGPINIYYADSLHNSKMFNWYGLLNYNMMHNYSSHSDSLGYDWAITNQRDGGFFEPLLSYQNYIDGVISQWNIFSQNNSLIFEREKVERGGYGQRSTYQAEYGQLYWDNRFPGYGYKNDSSVADDITDDENYGTNLTVKRCSINVNNPGYIVNGLIENGEQVNYYKIIDPNENRSGARLFTDIKQPHYNYKWHIKPRMRIDSLYAKAHPFDTVAILSIKNFSGNIIKQYTILCNHFLKYYNNTPFYDGKYIEMYYHINNELDNIPSTFYVKADSLIEGRTANNNWRNSKVDFSIKWCGKVNTYLDYVRIDDDWAHYLFTDVNGDYSNYKFHQKIAEEVNAFSGDYGFGYFYIDEIFYNNIPCVAEVNRIIKSMNSNTAMLIMGNAGRMFSEGGLKSENNETNIKAVLDTLISSGAEKDIFLDSSYPFYYKTYYPPNVETPDANSVPAASVFHKANSPEAYNIDSALGIQNAIQVPLNFCKYVRSKTAVNNLDYAFSIQVHSDECTIDVNNPDSWGLREPTNEEIRVQSYLAIALGVKQLLQYSFYSYLSSDRPNYNSWGLVYEDWAFGNGEFKKRLSNYYGQPKWSFVENLNQNIIALGNYMYPPGYTQKHLIYDKTISVNNNELSYRYINDIKSKIIVTTGNTQIHSVQGIGTVDNDQYRFWELGFFNPNPNNPVNPNDRSKYLLAVNKRCAPDTGNYSDERDLYIQFNNQQLQDFYNWKIIDALSNEEITTFNKNSNEYFYAGSFKPGEGRLLRIAPVMQEGGTLVCNEEIYGTDFDCNGIVYTNGKNVTLYEGTTVSFADSVFWSFSGGRFECGLANNSSVVPSDSVRLKGKSGSKWKGLILEDCEYTIIQYTTFNDLSDSSGFAVRLINSFNTTIKHNYFGLKGNAEFGAVSASYNNSSDDENYLYIDYNKIDALNAIPNAVEVSAYAGNVLSVYVRNNNFIQNSGNNNECAIYLNNASGSVVSENTITDYTVGIYLSSTSAYLQGNYISSSKQDSKGIYAVGGSIADLDPVSNYQTSGENIIILTGSGSYNINTDNSNFNVNNGYNTFDNAVDAIHFTGTFSGEVVSNVEAFRNCFKIGGQSSSAYSDVVWYDDPQTPVSFDFGENECESSRESILAEIITLPGDQRDSLYRYLLGGEGGANKDNFDEDIKNEQTLNLKILYDTLNLNVRRINYSNVITVGKQILNTYPDSIKCLDVVNKLYLAAQRTDTNGTVMQDMKNFFEMVIQNNSQNTSLINRTFYLIQKCKVSLHQYSSAMQGFQYIMQQFPYSFEGLVASWDYAATSLLMQNGGLSSGIILDTVKKKVEITNIRDEYDKKKFTTTDRNTIITNVETSIQIEKKKQETKLKTLELKIDSPKESVKKKEEYKKELNRMKTINEVVKAKKPKSVFEHIKNVSGDLRKIIKSGKSDNDKFKNEVSGIPKEFKLYQNYPNPFNPTTKISFDLPKDARVTIVIYDILGREIIKLINNEFRTAGKYTTEFTASTLSSGIYFYQIRTGDFIQAKKMLLLK